MEHEVGLGIGSGEWSALEKQREYSRQIPAASLASSHPLMLTLEYFRITAESLS